MNIKSIHAIKSAHGASFEKNNTQLTFEKTNGGYIFIVIYKDMSGFSISPPVFDNLTDLGDIQQTLISNRNFILQESGKDVFNLLRQD